MAYQTDDYLKAFVAQLNPFAVRRLRKILDSQRTDALVSKVVDDLEHDEDVMQRTLALAHKEIDRRKRLASRRGPHHTTLGKNPIERDLRAQVIRALYNLTMKALADDPSPAAIAVALKSPDSVETVRLALVRSPRTQTGKARAIVRAFMQDEGWPKIDDRTLMRLVRTDT